MDESAPPLDPDEARLRPTYAVVSLSRLRSNLAAIKTHVAPARVMPMLKANAYGHGLEAVARCLAPQADAFGVALVEEGIALRRLGIENPILVTGGTWTRQIPLFLEHRLTLTVPSLARLADVEQAAAAAGTTARVHLKIDTGMERLGVHYYNAQGLLEAALRSPHVEVEGIYTHFANADAEDLSHARLQLERFQEAAALLRAALTPRAAAAHRQLGCDPALPESHLDFVRPGHPALRCLPLPRRAEHGRRAARRCPGARVSSTSRWSSRGARSATARPGRAIIGCGW